MDIAKLSNEARTALTNVGTLRLGATIPGHTSSEVRAELLSAGLIGAGDGLTMQGSIARERIQSKDLDQLF